MECHEGATMIKTFRGLLADDIQDTIVLHTNDGSTGYRIVKFQIIGTNPAVSGQESTVKIYKVSQTSIDGVIDFSDNTLLGAAFWSGHDQTPNYPEDMIVIFDNEIFNQDIYITHHEENAAVAINYYMELEQVKLDLNESTVATLKDIRNERASITG